MTYVHYFTLVGLGYQLISQ